MPICKCGRNIPENATCFCSVKGIPVTVYTSDVKEPNFAHKDLSSKDVILSLVEYYRELWKRLHTYKLASEQENQEWFEFWKKELPCGECRRHFEKVLEVYPVDFSNQKAYFEWTVKVHNIVNKDLGKPEITIEEASLMWLKS